MNIDKILENLKAGIKNTVFILLYKAKVVEEFAKPNNGVIAYSLVSLSDYTNILVDDVNRFKELVIFKSSVNRCFIFFIILNNLSNI